MKRIFLIAFALLCFSVASVAKGESEIVYTDASQLGIIGKMDQVTQNPYHRVNTNIHKGFSSTERRLVKCSAGLSVAFTSDARSIWIHAEYAYKDYGVNTMGIALRGFDLYVKQGDQWLWAASGCPKLKSEDKPFELISGMDGREKEFLLYLPLYSEIKTLEIGVNDGAVIRSVQNPFRFRIGVYGSSFTQGISTSRPGMAWPSQLGRHTGFNMLNLGCSGNCMMQKQFEKVLCDAEVDAFIFDTFSNPDAATIKKRLYPFIEQLQKAHPGVPLIFLQTIYREKRNFNCDTDEYEHDKMAMASDLMKKACKSYKDVYFITPCATSEDHETSADGIHPSDMGYSIWVASIENEVLEILSKYGIK